MTINEFTRMLGDLAEIAVTIMLAYVVYKAALLLETLNKKVKEWKKP